MALVGFEPATSPLETYPPNELDRLTIVTYLVCKQVVFWYYLRLTKKLKLNFTWL